MPRCAYRHKRFEHRGASRHDGTDQCWLEEKYVGNFGTPGQPEFRCIFHAPDRSEPNDQDWPLARRGEQQAATLRELLDAWNAENKGRHQNPYAFVLEGLRCGAIDLSAYTFSGPVVFRDATFSGTTEFGGATFSGTTEFGGTTFSGGARFHDAIFSGDSGFHGTMFSDDTRFSDATFKGTAGFHDTTFSGYACFSYATFSGDAWFRGATFSDYARFGDTTFNSGAWFGDATFSGDAGFGDATFCSGAWFDDAIFSGDARFRGATFSQIAAFVGTTFQGAAWFPATVFNQLQLKHCRFEKPTSFTECLAHSLSYTTHQGERLAFNRCQVIDCSTHGRGQLEFSDQDCARLAFLNMDLSRADFLGADISQTRFISCEWLKNRKGYRGVPDHDGILADGDRNRVGLLHSLYQQLKKNLEDAREFHAAGDFHFREMEVRRHLRRMEGGYRVERGLLALYRFVADYGESYGKLFLSLVASFPVAAVLITVVERIRILMNSGDTITSANDLFRGFSGHLYTVFFGLAPPGLNKPLLEGLPGKLHWASQFILILEGLVALTLATLFVMALRRRFRR